MPGWTAVRPLSVISSMNQNKEETSKLSAVWLRLVAIVGGLTLTAMGFARAMVYEEIAVADRGTLTGTVALTGKMPVPKGYNQTILPDQVSCGRISD